MDARIDRRADRQKTTYESYHYSGYRCALLLVQHLGPEECHEFKASMGHAERPCIKNIQYGRGTMSVKKGLTTWSTSSDQEEVINETPKLNIQFMLHTGEKLA